MKSMKLVINGEDRAFGSSLTLAQLIDCLGMKPDRVAVERNRSIVPRGEWPNTQLEEGDRLEIVHFVGGGTEREEGPGRPRPQSPLRLWHN